MDVYWRPRWTPAGGLDLFHLLIVVATSIVIIVVLGDLDARAIDLSHET